MLTILILSAIPIKNLPEISLSKLPADKIGHFLIYAILSLVLLLFLENNNISKKRLLTKTLFIAIAYGILMELLQLLIFQQRSFEFLDIIANISGSICGVLFYYIIFGKRF